MSNLKKYNLIVPVAADSKEGSNTMPYVFGVDCYGIMLCLKAITGINYKDFDNIYFTLLRKHVEAFNVDSILRLQFKRLGIDKADIVILDEPTVSQPETVAKTIEAKGLGGSIFIKDADNFFNATIYPENGVAVFPLENLEIVDPRNKSYVAVDDMQYVTNIIEKRIISNLFSAGGYSFANCETFMNIFNKYKHLGNLYLSHLIYALLLEGENFRPIKVTDYVDFSLNINH